MKSGLAALTASLLFLAPLDAAGISPDFPRTKYGFFIHHVWADVGGGLTLDCGRRQPVGFATNMAAWQNVFRILSAWHQALNLTC
jgi:hypothetical protein